MTDEESEWSVPTDANVEVQVEVTDSDDTPFGMLIRAKEEPIASQVGLTIEQAAMLQHTLDELLDELEERPNVRTRSVDEADSRHGGMYQ